MTPLNPPLGADRLVSAALLACMSVLQLASLACSSEQLANGLPRFALSSSLEQPDDCWRQPNGCTGGSAMDYAVGRMKTDAPSPEDCDGFRLLGPNEQVICAPFAALAEDAPDGNSSTDWLLEVQRVAERGTDTFGRIEEENAQAGVELGGQQKELSETRTDRCNELGDLNDSDRAQECRQIAATTEADRRPRLPGGTRRKAAGLLHWQQQQLQRLAQLASDGRRRHELATRAGARSQQRQLHHRPYRLTTDDARKLLEAQRQRLAGLAPELAERSGAFSYREADSVSAPDQATAPGSVSAPNTARTPIVLVRLADIRNERRSAPFRLHRSGAEQAHSAGALNPLGSNQLPELLTGQSVSMTAASAATNQSSGDSREQPTASVSAQSTSDEALECNLLRHKFLARRSDSNGNSCTGDITASICYGGCDTGEIADWLFPHKKSIHKVCTHGGRIRRRVILDKCNSPYAERHLSEYYYVDALSCSCKRCSSADTTCVGSLSRPDPKTSVDATSAPDLDREAGGNRE